MLVALQSGYTMQRFYNHFTTDRFQSVKSPFTLVALNGSGEHTIEQQMAALGFPSRFPSSFSHFEVLVLAWNLQRRPLQSQGSTDFVVEAL